MTTMSRVPHCDRRAESNTLPHGHSLHDIMLMHGPYLRAVCRRWTDSDDDAEDVLQDTLIAIHRNLDRFRGESSLRTWLFAVARSQAHRLRRKDAKHRGRGRRVESEVEQSDALSSGEFEPLDDFRRCDIQWSLRRGLTRLNETDRQVLWLRDYEGRSAEETASALQLTVPAVKSRLLRARRRMRETLLETEPVVQLGDLPDAVGLS